MNALSLINFDQYNITAICDIIISRVYPNIKQKLNIINEFLYDNDFEAFQINAVFGIDFLRLSDEIFQLMRLEEKVLFEYIKSQDTSILPIHISAHSKLRVNNHQVLIMKLLLELRLVYTQQIGALTNKDIKIELLDSDLYELESLVKIWISIVNQRILQYSK